MKPHADKPVLLQVIHSFRYALVGFRVLARDRNMMVHVLASAIAISLGIWFRVSAIEWCILTLTITLVVCLEAMNSALEFAVDLASPEFHPLAAKSKDVASAAVLIAAIGAAVIGAIVFVPRFLNP